MTEYGDQGDSARINQMIRAFFFGIKKRKGLLVTKPDAVIDIGGVFV